MHHLAAVLAAYDAQADIARGTVNQPGGWGHRGYARLHELVEAIDKLYIHVRSMGRFE